MNHYRVEKTIRWIFILAFMGMLIVPFLFANHKPGQISRTENRTLAPSAEPFNEDGSRNEYYLRDVSTWLDDNVGFREELVSQHAEIQYHLFRRLISPIYKMGPEGEWNYVAEQVIPSYQHSNLLSDDEVEMIYRDFKTVNGWLESQGVSFYYLQCWDKQSIYPEQFPRGVNQYGTVSKTDQIVNRLKEDSSIHLIDTKPCLVAGKSQYDTYSRLGDPAHWSNRGAYLGYRETMETIRQDQGVMYPVLQESDYDLGLEDAGFDMPGSIHLPDMQEAFRIRDPKAVVTNEKFTIDADDERDVFYTNTSCGNDTRILIIGDSYIQMSILDDFAESFGETALIWKENISDIINLVDSYHPDIILYEQAERELDFAPLSEAAAAIRSVTREENAQE